MFASSGLRRDERLLELRLAPEHVEHAALLGAERGVEDEHETELLARGPERVEVPVVVRRERGVVHRAG